MTLSRTQFDPETTGPEPSEAMTSQNETRFTVVLISGLILCLWAMFGGMLLAQEEPAEPSAADVMLQTILSDSTPEDIRQANAESLYRDPTAHDALAAVLGGDGNHQARVIICRLLAARGEAFPATNGDASIPAVFFDPLFAALRSEDAELSLVAARGLAQCHDGVVARLASIAAGQGEPPAHRLAALRALELTPGRQAVLALGGLISDGDEQIVAKASQAVAMRLGLSAAADPSIFREQLQAQLEKMSDDDFLRWELILERRSSRQVGEQLAGTRRQVDQWQQWCLIGWSWEFERREPAAKLAFLSERLSTAGDALVRTWSLEQVNSWCDGGTAEQDGVAPEVASFLSGFVADDDAGVRRLAARSAWQLGESGRVLAQAIAEQLGAEQDRQAQAEQLRAVGAFAYVPAADTAMNLLGCGDLAVAIEAARALSKVIVGGSDAVSSELTERIAKRVVTVYPQQPSSAALRSELIGVMNKIAGLSGNRDLAVGQFGSVLQDALGDEAGVVRLNAVRVLDDLYGADTLAMLVEGDRDMLSDGDTRVRAAAIDVVRQYGGADELQKLRDRLSRETEQEVINTAILPACKAILERLDAAESHRLVVDLRSLQGNEEGLHRVSLACLLAKIAEDRSADRPVPSEFEQEAYVQKAELELRANQPEQAANWYAKLLNLDLTAELRSDYAKKLLALLLDHSDNQTILAEATSGVSQWLAGAGSEDGWAMIGQACDSVDPAKADQAVDVARIVVALVVPIKEHSSPETQARWVTRREALALRLVDQQYSIVKDTKGKANAEVISLIKGLDGRLNNYPVNGSLEQQLVALDSFRAILQPPPPQPEEAPASDVVPPTPTVQESAAPSSTGAQGQPAAK